MLNHCSISFSTVVGAVCCAAQRRLRLMREHPAARSDMMNMMAILCMMSDIMPAKLSISHRRAKSVHYCLPPVHCSRIHSTRSMAPPLARASTMLTPGVSCTPFMVNVAYPSGVILPRRRPLT